MENYMQKNPAENVSPMDEEIRPRLPAFRNALRPFQRLDYFKIFIVISGLVFAMTIRVYLMDFKSLDYYASLKPWYNTIKTLGFSAFGTNFSTYNPPYLYLLYLIARFFPDIPVVIAVKLPALFADFICAYFVSLIVKIKHPGGQASLLSGMITLFAPTVVLNSAFWGQADSLYTAGLLACIFFLLKRKHALAMLAFGIALAFKLQAVFLAPFLLALFWRRDIRWKNFLIVPLILILALMPAWIAGRPILDLLNIYLFQTSQFELLTMNAPTIFAWFPATKMVFNHFYLPGVIIGIIAAFILFLLIYKSARKLNQPVLVELALLSVLLIPFFLPKMHERYFYPADMISIVFAFFFPRFFYIPILVGGVSFLAYQPYLFGREPVPLGILALILLTTISIITYHSVDFLYSSTPNENTALTPENSEIGADNKETLLEDTA